MPVSTSSFVSDEPREPVHADRVLQRDQVDPAAAARPPGRGAELAAGLAHALADLVVELGRERASTDARAVGLRDAPHLVDRRRSDACAGARCAGDRVRGGHEGIGAVVDVEQRALRALEDHQLAAVEALPRDRGRVGDVGREPVAVGHVVLGHLVQIERAGPWRTRAAPGRLGSSAALIFSLEDLLVEHVLNADAEPRGLVGVARPDAALVVPISRLPSFASPAWSSSRW